MRAKSGKTASRKQEHVDFAVVKDVAFRLKTSGFDRWEFVHNALPELDYSEIDCSVSFLGKTLSSPFIISSMTGGYREAIAINRQLAEVCQEKKLAMGVGSQRQAMEDTRFHRSYTIVREVAKDIPIIGNIGAAEIAHLEDASSIIRLAELIDANAFAVHLNPLQELLQPEGSPDFKGVLTGIEKLVRQLKIPIIVKEVGAGISASVARRLLEVGVSIIDVAGAGGTSWAGVEILRRSRSTKNDFAGNFWDWGIPTVDAVRQVCSLKREHPSLVVIASGGVRHGLDVAKAIAFGADLGASARPMLQALKAGGTKRLIGLIENIEMELKGAMFLTGSRTLRDLQQQQLLLAS
jgi:isopentenyl-diphosphate delta-isomerase